MSKTDKSGHYGYTYYSDREVVEDYNRDRYGYEFGRYLFRYEVDAFLDNLSPDGKVLDVGTGTGKLLLSLLERDMDVRAVDASREMLSFLRRSTGGDRLSGRLFVADAQELPFADRSFDSVVSSRVLMHLCDWRRGIREFCRLSNRDVVIDIPPVSGFTFLIPLKNVVERMFSRTPRPYRVFTVRAVAGEFATNGFAVTGTKRLFFLPIGVHRKINNITVSRWLEGLFRVTGLTRVFGGPVIIRAERVGPKAAPAKED